jgi:hypothetical protein
MDLLHLLLHLLHFFLHLSHLSGALFVRWEDSLALVGARMVGSVVFFVRGLRDG